MKSFKRKPCGLFGNKEQIFISVVATLTYLQFVQAHATLSSSSVHAYQRRNTSEARDWSEQHQQQQQQHQDARGLGHRDQLTEAAALIGASAALNRGSSGESAGGYSYSDGGAAAAGGYSSGSSFGGHSSGSGSSVGSSYGVPAQSYGVGSFGGGGGSTFGSSVSQAYGVPAHSSGGISAHSGYSNSYTSGNRPGAMTFHYQNIPHQGSTGGSGSSGWGMNDDDDEDGNSSSEGGIGAAIAALAGIKGIKGLKAVKLIKKLILFPALLPALAPVLGPLFAPLLLLLLLPLFLILLPILLLFLPIPVITVPSNGRAFGSVGINSTELLSKLSNMTSSLTSASGARSTELNNLFSLFLMSSDCVERISCEIGKISRDYQGVSGLAKTILSKLAKWSPTLYRRIEDAGRGSCFRYKCGAFF